MQFRWTLWRLLLVWISKCCILKFLNFIPRNLVYVCVCVYVCVFVCVCACVYVYICMCVCWGYVNQFLGNYYAICWLYVVTQFLGYHKSILFWFTWSLLNTWNNCQCFKESIFFIHLDSQLLLKRSWPSPPLRPPSLTALDLPELGACATSLLLLLSSVSCFTGAVEA